MIIAAATLLAYIPAFRADYVWDDDSYVTENQIIQSWDGLPKIWLTQQTPQYYPLVFTSFWIEHKLWNLHATGYHIVNALLHIANAILVWRIARRLKIPGAWFIGAVFALHPVHVESVAWITERKNVLSGLFYLLALRSYLRFDESGRWKFYGAAVALFVAALLSKTVTAMLPAVLPFVVFFKNGTISLRKLACVLPLLAIGAALGLHTAYLERAKVGAEGIEFAQTMLQRTLIIAPNAYAFYAQKILWPYPLMFNYPRWDVDSGEWALYLPLLVVVAAFATALGGVRRFGWGPLVLLLFSAITLFPALGFLNVYPHRYSYVADHFQYLGSLGFIGLFATGAVWLGRRTLSARQARKIGLALGALVLVVLAGLTFRQSRSYQNEIRLWQDTLAANPQSGQALLTLSYRYLQERRFDEAIALAKRATEFPLYRSDAYLNWASALQGQERYDDALLRYREALQVNPQNRSAFTNLGAALMRVGRLDEAADVLERAVSRWPDYHLTRYNLAAVRERQGRFDEAGRHLKRLVELKPDVAEFQRARGEFLFQRGRYGDAIPYLRNALRSARENPSAWFALIGSLTESGRYADALRACQSALATRTSVAGHRERTAWLLATCPDDMIRNGPQAQRIVDQLQKTLGPNVPPDFVDTFAAVAAENGDFATAMRLTEQNLQLARAANAPHLVARCRERLALYRASQPFRHQAR